MVIKAPPIKLNIKPRMVNHVLEHALEYVWEHVLVSFKHVFLVSVLEATPNYILNMYVLLRKVTAQELSTLHTSIKR